MYPWDVLNLAETDDKRAIKKSYAKLLRKYRPDEYPEKFQEINQAYQYAVSLIHNNFSEKANPVTPPTSNSVETINESIEEIDSLNEFDADETNSDLKKLEDIMPPELTDNSADIQLVENIIEQFHQMAFVEYKIKKQKSSWRFLDSYHDIKDLSLRDQLSKELFKRVVEYNQFQLKENKTLLLNKFMIKTIADVFDWENDWNELHLLFPEAYVDHVFKQLEPQSQLSNFSILFLRTMSICLEFLVAIGLAKIYMLRPWAPMDESIEVISIFIFIVINIGTMTSEISLSYIQFALGFRAYDKYLNLTDTSIDSKRAVMFQLFMCPFYFIYYNSAQYLSMMVPVIGFIFVLNLFFWWKNKQLFHDWISGTVILK